MYGDERIVLEYVLEPAISAKLYGVELSELDLAALPLPEEAVKYILPLLRFAAYNYHLPVFPDLVGHAFQMRRKGELADLHKILHTAKYNITTYRNNKECLFFAIPFN